MAQLVYTLREHPLFNLSQEALIERRHLKLYFHQPYNSGYYNQRDDHRKSAYYNRQHSKPRHRYVHK